MRNKIPMTKHVFNAHFVGPKSHEVGNKPKQKKGHMSQLRGLKVGNQPLFILNQKTTRDPYKRTKPLRMN